LTIGADGNIKAEINAKSVIVIGHVEGNIRGIERVEIHGTGRVEGNVSAPKLVVTEGAQINGTIHMTDAEGIGRSSSPPSQPSSTAAASEVRKAG
jgi:cytoskeletal protein CcmA (bactofilin family)